MKELIEQIKSDFFSDAIREPDYQLRRINVKGNRFYYVIEDGKPRFYLSVTSVTNLAMCTGYGLDRWKMENFSSESQYKEYMSYQADYGTLLHALAGEYLITGQMDFTNITDTALGILAGLGRELDYLEEIEAEIKKDLLAFIQFVQDRNVKPLAIEVGLKSDKLGLGGMQDLPCEMDWQGKRVTAIVDLKKGRKGFYPGHEVQLSIYREIWNENFPEMPATHTFNWSPKDWRTKPTYNLKNQTETTEAENIPHYIAIALNKAGDPASMTMKPEISGIVNNDTDLAKLVKVQTVTDYILNNERPEA